MICKKCGAEIDINANFCPYCNEPVIEEQKRVEVNLGYDAPQNTQNKKMSVKALVGFIVAMAGIIIAAIPCGIVGLIFSIKGKKEAETMGLNGRGLAIAGIVVAIIDIAFGVFSIFKMIALAEAYLSMFSFF